MAKPKFNPNDYDSLGIGNLPDVLLNATLDANATDGNGHTLNGSGNPASGWEIQNNGPFQIFAAIDPIRIAKFSAGSRHVRLALSSVRSTSRHGLARS